uniref:carbonyl reductase (NADPH) n=1 Tax=Hemiscolopendra marginata TaxID=943146 RepID=A0A646QFS3_9MYRI
MSISKRIAVVTGGNKGIGYSIVKELCSKFDGIVYLTARNVKLGEEAVNNLKKEGYDPQFHQLDIEDEKSINTFAEYVKKKYSGLDVLVNNAAIAYKHDSTAPFGEQAENTVKINFFGLFNVCQSLFPLLRPHARVVNISSSAGMLSKIPDAELKKRLASEDLSEKELCQLMEDFVNAAKAGEHVQKGWGSSAYSVSKVGVTALTIIQQRQFNKDPREDIIVNAVHPGYVDTDMTSHKGPLTPEQGAAAPSYAALLPPSVQEPKGQMIWQDKSVVQWAS